MAISSGAGNVTNVGTISLDLILNSNNFRTQLNNVGNQTTGLSTKFAGLGKVIAATFAVQQVYQFSKVCVDAFAKAEQGALKLYATLSGQGMGLDSADNFISKYIEDGMVSLSEAQTAYANLAAMGMKDSQIENIMNTLKDSASVARQSSYTIGQAITTATSGMKQGISNVVDNAGIDTNLSVMEKEYKKLHGIVGELTKEQRNAAYEMGVMNEGAKYLGVAEKMASRYAGTTQRLSQQWAQFKINIGSIVSHVLGPLNNALTSILKTINACTSSFAEFLNELTGTESVKSLFTNSENSVSNIADSVEDATEAIGGAAASAAEEIAGSLAPIDMLNTIDSGSSSGGGGGGSSIELGQNETNILDDINKELDKTNEKINLFKQGIKEGCQANPQKLLNNISRIRNAFSNIAKQINVDELVKSFSLNAGRVLGSFASVGTSIGTSLTGGIAKALEDNSESIVKWANAIVGELSGIFNQFGEYAKAVANIFTAFEGENAENLFANLFEIIGTAVGTVTEIIVKFKKDLVTFLTQPIIDNQDKIREALNGTLGVFATITNTYKKLIGTIGSSLTGLYDEHIRPFFSSLTETLSEWVGIIVDGYNDYILPVIQGLAEKSGELGEQMQPVIEDLKDILGDVIDVLKILWESYVKPLVSYLLSSVIPVVGKILEVVGKVAIFIGSTFIEALAGGISGIKTISNVLKTLIGITADVFSAFVDMKDGIVNAFKLIPDAIKTAINGAIGLINGMIQSMNKLSFDIPSLTGEDKHVGFNIPTIPLLASGGYFTKYNPRLAIIGEGQYDEIVANSKQLDNLASSIVNGVVSSIGNIRNTSSGDVYVYLGNKDVTDVVVKEINRTNTRLGKNRI